MPFFKWIKQPKHGRWHRIARPERSVLGGVKTHARTMCSLRIPLEGNLKLTNEQTDPTLNICATCRKLM